MEIADTNPYLASVHSEPLHHPSPPAPLRENIRDEWLIEPDVAFLNHGSFGASPRVVFEAQEVWRRRIEAAPVEHLARRCVDLIDAAKEKVGAWLGMRTEDFGFVTNATEGVNAVLNSLRFSPGDELLTTTHVYNAVHQAMKHVAARSGAAVRVVDVPLPLRSATEIAEAVLREIRPETRLLVIDHITSPTGLIFPVEAIAAGCAARGVDMLIDGAHAPGMLPLNIEQICGAGAPYYAGNLHKWTCAPRGTGFLWVRPDRQTEIHPVVISHYLGEGFAREFGWQGTRDLSGWLTVPRAIQYFEELGWDRMRAHNHGLAAWAHEMLCRRWKVDPISPIDGSMLGFMAAVELPPPLDRLDAAQIATLQQRLYSEFRIEVPLMPRIQRQMLRVSAQVYNTPDEYERLAGVIEAIAREYA